MLTIEDMRAVAVERGGQCLSGPFSKRRRTKLQFRCAKGHEWPAFADNVLRGTWCPYCSGHAKTLADMQAMAAERGGECLSADYTKAYNELRWRCDAGHEWDETPARVRAGRWCPECAVSASKAYSRNGTPLRARLLKSHPLHLAESAPPRDSRRGA